MQLYPIITQRLTTQNSNEKQTAFWQAVSSSEQIYYGVYSNYQSNDEYDFSIANDTPNNSKLPPIQVEDFGFYETFHCTKKELFATWDGIKRKAKQGLLKRLYSVDFEKYYPDGKIEIYVSIVPHC